MCTRPWPAQDAYDTISFHSHEFNGRIYLSSDHKTAQRRHKTVYTRSILQSLAEGSSKLMWPFGCMMKEAPIRRVMRELEGTKVVMEEARKMVIFSVLALAIVSGTKWLDRED